MSETTSKKRRLSLPLVIAGGVSSLVLALGMSPTFSAFTASITNTGNTAGTGTLSMAETNSGTSVICSSGLTGAATCGTNKYGGISTMVPGTPVATDITIKNTGTAAASSFTLYFGACSNTPTTIDLCSKMLVEVKYTGSIPKVLTPAASTAASLATTYPQAAALDIKLALGGSPIAGGTSAVAIPFTITVTMPTGTGDNAFQGAQILQSMTWLFQA